MIIFMIIMTIPACRKPAEKPSRPVIITSVFPICDLVRQVTGKRMDVQFIIPAGTNPHHYEIRPSQVRNMSQAYGFIGVQTEFDGWIRQYLPDNSQVLNLMNENDAYRGPDDSGHNENPHIWLSVREASRIVHSVEEWLARIDPAGRIEYENNAALAVSRLDTLDRTIKKLMEPIPNKKFIQWHAAWDRFAADYGLHIIGTLQKGHGREITLKAFQALIGSARREQVRVVVIGITQQDPAVKPLIGEIQGILVRLDTLGDPYRSDRNTYTRFMLRNARLLAQALEAQ